MSKIICDVCGTSYPDSSKQCPICGSVRAVDTNNIDGTAVDSGSSVRENYTYVKGGRFSKKNVKKRNVHNLKENTQVANDDFYAEYEDQPNSGKGLVALVVVLLLAVIAVAAYIMITFFDPMDFFADLNLFSGETTAATQEATEDTTAPDLSCTEIILDKDEFTFENAGDEVTLDVKVVPGDTEDDLIFTSADEEVATVSEDGAITAVGVGETTITVSCGEISEKCKVICAFVEETTVPETTEPAKTYTEPYALNKADVTIRVGDKFELYFQDANKEKIEVTYNIADPAICSVEGTVVTGLAKGKSDVQVTYNGQTYTCIVRVY